MRLPQPFYRLPIHFDIERLKCEVAALPADAWVKHPNEIPGNTSVRLISAGGGENDAVDGAMRQTPYLLASPYMRQILASFNVVWGRSRLMRLAPGASVPQHSDINYHWFSRVRLHVPIRTQPEVMFYCEPDTVHMAAGDAWVFDNWRQHSVINPTDKERIHLVADTSGSAAFWQYVLQSRNVTTRQFYPFDPNVDATPLTEQATMPKVMSPAEIELLLLDMRAELATQPDNDETRARLAQYHAVLDGFCKDWRQCYALYGADAAHESKFVEMRDKLRAISRSLADGLVMRTNRVAAHTVLEGRLMRAVAAESQDPRSGSDSRLDNFKIDRPIFIVAAPRSGSTLLFESLAHHANVATLGGEAHWLVESNISLQPGAGVDSNRLGAEQVSGGVRDDLHKKLLSELRDSQGKRLAAPNASRLLEKTPKNALRIPFFNRLFPDAMFVFLWRDPRENISSIMEAWRSGQWRTYNGLKGFDGPWSLLLPPGWQTMNGRPLEEIAAFQWEATNRIVLDDLSLLPRHRWMAIDYASLISDPKTTLEGVCRFAGLPTTDDLSARWSKPLPNSRYTHTPPEPEKWRRNQLEIERVLPIVEFTWRRLRSIQQ